MNETERGSGSRLVDLAQVIRSKNAGPFTLTLDVMFDDAATFRRVEQSGVLEPALLSRLYGVPADEIAVIPFPEAKALKITMPRQVPSGDVTDTDVYATQQHVPLMQVEVPA